MYNDSKIEPHPHTQTPGELLSYSILLSIFHQKKIQCHYTPISQLYYIAVMEPSTKVPIIDLDESEEETEEEREFTTTWGE